MTGLGRASRRLWQGIVYHDKTTGTIVRATVGDCQAQTRLVAPVVFFCALEGAAPRTCAIRAADRALYAAKEGGRNGVAGARSDDRQPVES